MFKRIANPRVQRPKLSLIWHRDKLLLSGTKTSVRLDTESASTWDALAIAAKTLLAKQRHKTIALYLPGQYFIGTQMDLPGVPINALEGAIKLQLDTILPGQEQDLLAKVALHLEPKGNYQVLCFSQKLANSIYQLFAKQGIHVLSILPRALLAVNNTKTGCQVLEQDDDGQTLLKWQQGRLLQWAYISNDDLNNPEFAQEWQALQQAADNSEQQHLQHLGDWQAQKINIAQTKQYAFIPPQALAQRLARQHRSKRIGAYILLGLFCLSLVGAAWALWRYENRIDAELEKLKFVTADIRHLRDEVFAIEDELAAIDNFPDQHIDSLLAGLNSLVPKDSWLIQFDIKKGILTLEGYSPNPTDLLNKLAEHPEFSQVAFNKPISSATGTGGTDRFGISLKINGVDVEGYVQSYYLQGESP